MRNLSSVVMILMLEMFDTWYHFKSCGILAPHHVSDDQAWDIPQPFEELAKEPLLPPSYLSVSGQEYLRTSPS